MSEVNFGVPQGSIMGPLLFNLFVEDIEAHINAKCHQCADDTTLYLHCKAHDLASTVERLQGAIHGLENWAKDVNLTLNPTKTKLMLLSTSHLSSFHSLYKAEAVINANGNTLERVSSIKLLGTHIQQHVLDVGRQREGSCLALLCHIDYVTKV